MILFLWAESANTREIYGTTTHHYGNNRTSHRKLIEWVERLKGRLTNVTDDARSG